MTKPEKEKRDGRHLVITVKFENPDWRAPAPLERAAFGTFLQADHRESYIFDDFFLLPTQLRSSGPPIFIIAELNDTCARYMIAWEGGGRRGGRRKK